MRDEDFEGFIEEFGEATTRVSVPDSEIKKWSGILPAQLLDYWRDEGWSAYADGLFWIVNPEDYEDLKDEWLASTPIEAIDDFYVIARTAFGKLFLWGKKSGASVTISCYTNSITFLESKLSRTIDDPDFYVRTFFGSLTRHRCDLKDESGKPLFDRARKKLGSVTENEVYGFEPALALGGEIALPNLARLNLDVHLTILRELGAPELPFGNGKVEL